MLRKLGASPAMTGAKAMYDASRSATAGSGLSQERTAIESAMANERLAAIQATWKERAELNEPLQDARREHAAGGGARRHRRGRMRQLVTCLVKHTLAARCEAIDFGHRCHTPEF